jgi:hypothetical protein
MSDTRKEYELPGGMRNLSHPNGIAKRFYDLVQEIERLPASEQQTKCVIVAGEVRECVIKLLEKQEAELLMWEAAKFFSEHKGVRP